MMKNESESMEDLSPRRQFQIFDCYFFFQLIMSNNPLFSLDAHDHHCHAILGYKWLSSLEGNICQTKSADRPESLHLQKANVF